MEQDRGVADDGGVRRFEVLIPRLRRPGLLSELELRCARIGVRCQPATRRWGSQGGRALTLTVPAEVDRHAFAELSRWIYVQIGTRPYDTAESAAVAAREREAARTRRSRVDHAGARVHRGSPGPCGVPARRRGDLRGVRSAMGGPDAA